MSDIAIRVQNLSKHYKIGATIGHDRLKDLLASSLSSLFRRRPRVSGPDSPLSSVPCSSPSYGSNLQSAPSNSQFPIPNSQSNYIWALKNVSFEVKQGETLGIIGANGAGKSTLLKILSRITEPTSGKAEIYGRVGSLLEVGTGFDRELTGRENVYLNGAILGMYKREIDRKFDEIVDFSGVEQFIDTPVKHYSSGMRVRLAFAVAAHLDPEILIVDEVLAVGDAAFQKKCLAKMESVRSEGKTVLFVSHNMPSIQSLCNRGMVLHGGHVVHENSSDAAVRHYLEHVRGQIPAISLHAFNDRKGTGAIRIDHAMVTGSSSNNPHTYMDDDITITLSFKTFSPVPDCNFGLHIRNSLGQVIYRVITRDTFGSVLEIRYDGRISCTIVQPRLLPGKYDVYVVVSSNTARGARERIDEIHTAAQFEVTPADVYGTGKIPEQGIIYATCKWELSEIHGGR